MLKHPCIPKIKCFCILSHMLGIEWYLIVVLISVFLILMIWVHFCISTSQFNLLFCKVHIQTFSPFIYWVSLLLICRSLCILNINPISITFVVKYLPICDVFSLYVFLERDVHYFKVAKFSLFCMGLIFKITFRNFFPTSCYKVNFLHCLQGIKILKFS